MSSPETLSTPEDFAARARRLSAGTDRDAAVQELLDAAGERREVLEAARDQMAGEVHARVDDFEATAALQLLNRALSKLPRHDPLDWRVRWTQRFRRP